MELAYIRWDPLGVRERRGSTCKINKIILPSNSFIYLWSQLWIAVFWLHDISVIIWLLRFIWCKLVLQVLQAEPDDSAFINCRYVDARNIEECQNYHHVLQFPQGPGAINNVPLNQTVLSCGSNSFSPRCSYRRVRPPPHKADLLSPPTSQDLFGKCQYDSLFINVIYILHIIIYLCSVTTFKL